MKNLMAVQMGMIWKLNSPSLTWKQCINPAFKFRRGDRTLRNTVNVRPPTILPCAQLVRAEDEGKLASAVGLIMGTAIGPGILGLPSATLPAGLQVSSVMILGAWAYVMSSILLVAELSYALMAERGEKEVSFTGLVSHTVGYKGACVVAVVYAGLNYALLVACIAGLGSILNHWLPISVPVLCVFSSALVGALVAYAPFQIVDRSNRFLCGLMLVGMASLIGIGVYAGRDLVGRSGASDLVLLKSVWQAVPVTVLTLGFHVITPVVCKVVGGRPRDGRRAILCGGVIPLAMVLAWNGVILSIAPAGSPTLNSINLLMSLSRSAAPAVHIFAFAALGTTLIGYALSFPKQLADTVVLFQNGRIPDASNDNGPRVTVISNKKLGPQSLLWALVPPTVISVACPSAFTSALDFAGIYANCFLFGVIPPVMAWISRYGHPKRQQSMNDGLLLPGGKGPLLLLFGISLVFVFRGGA